MTGRDKTERGSGVYAYSTGLRSTGRDTVEWLTTNLKSASLYREWGFESLAAREPRLETVTAKGASDLTTSATR